MSETIISQSIKEHYGFTYREFNVLTINEFELRFGLTA